MSYDIIVVGCGGTGTFFLKEFCRYAAGNAALKNKVTLTIVDGDIVEEKNLLRQSFSPEDIGRNKAEAFTQALIDSFDLRFSVCFSSKYISDVSDLAELMSGNRSIPVLIGCCDNGSCRKVMEEFFDKVKTCVYYDSGNSYLEGQTVYAVKNEGLVLSPPGSFYGAYEDDRPRAQLSCEELNNSSPQHILANMQASIPLLYGITRLLEEKQFMQGIVTFDLSHMKLNFQSAKDYGFSSQKKAKGKKGGKKHG